MPKAAGDGPHRADDDGGVFGAMQELTLFSWTNGWGRELADGLAVTILLASLSFVLGTAVGLLGAIGEMSSRRLLAAPLATYAAVLRSLPELLIIFLVYYGGGFAVQALVSAFGFSAQLEVPPFAAGVVALSLIHGAYVSEVFHGAFLAVPTGAIEAARALGLRPRLLFWIVRLPIAARLALPGLANLWMVLIKNTPLVSAIGLLDLVRAAATAGENTKHFFTFYGSVLVAYLVLSGGTMIVQGAIERRAHRHLGTVLPS